MLRLEVRTRLSPEEAIQQAVNYFGPGGHGMEIRDQSSECAYFEGGGGKVDIATCSDKQGTSVELISQEWDYQVGEFSRKIAG